MKTDNGLAIALFAVVIGGAVALAIANDITAPICRAAAEAIPKDKFDFGCLEFWLNRYQTTIAALCSIATAVLLFRPAISQLTEMRRQSSADARAVLREIIAERASEVSAGRTILHSLWSADLRIDMVDNYEAFGFSEPPNDDAHAVFVEADTAIATIEQFIGSDPAELDLETARSSLVTDFSALRFEVRTYVEGRGSLATLGKTPSGINAALSKRIASAEASVKLIMTHGEAAIRKSRRDIRDLEDQILHR